MREQRTASESVAPWRIPGPREQTIPSAENFFKALLFPLALLASFAATLPLVHAIDAALPGSWLGGALGLACVASFAVWDCLLLTAMGILAHDAVHRVLFRTPFWNELAGGLLSALALIPFYANRQFHLTHHSYAHQPGLDPENEMHDHGFFYAATLGSVLALYLQYRNVYRSVLKAGDVRHAARAAKDLLLLTAAALFYFALVPALGIPLLLTVVPMLLALPAVFAWRALSDHYGIPAAERAARREEVLEVATGVGPGRREVSGWVILTSSWLEWLWSHVNYHEVHHKYPWLSHVHLRNAFEATRTTEPYLVVRGYWRSLLRIAHSRYYGKRDGLRPYLSTPEW